MPPENPADRQLLPQLRKLLPPGSNPSLGNRDFHMRFGRLILRALPMGLLFCSLCTSGQQLHSSAGTVRAGVTGGAEGRLTVTATVVSSVGLVVGPDGEQRLVVANAADPRDNVSRLDSIAIKLTPVTDAVPKVKKKKR